MILAAHSIVVGSTDDPWITAARAHSLAAEWSCHFVDSGEAGHINAASGLGAWYEGQELLERIIAAGGNVRTPGDARRVLANHTRTYRADRASL